MLTSLILALGLSSTPAELPQESVVTPAIHTEEARRSFGRTRISEAEEARRSFGRTRISETEEARRSFGRTRI